jgi:P27 family predicted phage terminase small subunit
VATRGRKPTPTHLKLVRGNPGKRALPKKGEELPVVIEEVSPPPFLSDDAKVEWGRMMQALVALKLVSSLDRSAFAAYCQAYGRWAQAERALAAMRERDPHSAGLLVKTTGDNIVQNPLVGIANKAMSDMVRYAAEFGMTPSARVRLNGSGGGGAQENPFNAFKRPGRS